MQVLVQNLLLDPMQNARSTSLTQMGEVRPALLLTATSDLRSVFSTVEFLFQDLLLAAATDGRCSDWEAACGGRCMGYDRVEEVANHLGFLADSPDGLLGRITLGRFPELGEQLLVALDHCAAPELAVR